MSISKSKNIGWYSDAELNELETKVKAAKRVKASAYTEFDEISNRFQAAGCLSTTPKSELDRLQAIVIEKHAAFYKAANDCDAAHSVLYIARDTRSKN